MCIYIAEGEVKKGMYRMPFISSPLSKPEVCVTAAEDWSCFNQYARLRCFRV